MITNLINDWLLGISTRGTAAVDHPGAVYYATIAYAETRRVLRRLELKPDDVFFDIGCGKGRVLCLAARYRIQHAVGIECSPPLAAIASRNAFAMRGKRSPIVVLQGGADLFRYRSATVIYMFNPFEADVLNDVLTRIYDTRTQPLRIAFVMESAEQRKVFKWHEWLTPYDHWEGDHPTTFYRTA